MYEEYEFYDKDSDEDIPKFSSKRIKTIKHDYCSEKVDNRRNRNNNKKYNDKYNKAKDLKESRWN